MTSQQPPKPWFNAINYNPDFFISGAGSGGISLAYANANYLRITSGSNPISSAATTTFNGQLIATSNPNSIVSIANTVALSPITTGIIYLTGVDSSVGGNYVMRTDINSHIQFACGTNSLNLGISGGANGNINMYGASCALTIPTCTGTAISVPLGKISGASLTSTTGLISSGNNILFTGTTVSSSVIYSSNTADSIIYQGPPSLTYGHVFTTNAGGSGPALTIYPTGASTAQITINSPLSITSSTTTTGNIYLNGPSSFILNNIGTAGQNLSVGTVFGGGGLFLQAQGQNSMVITGTTITNYMNTTLPIAGVVPTAGQLGYTNTIPFYPGTALASNTVRLLATFTNIPVGTYLFTGCASYVCTTAGTTTQIGCGFSNSSTAYQLPNTGIAGQLGTSNNLTTSTQTFTASGVTEYLNSSTVVTLTAITTVYFLTYWTQLATSAFTVGGNAQYTRIA